MTGLVAKDESGLLIPNRAECNCSAYSGIKEVKQAPNTGKPDSVFSDLLAFKPAKNSKPWMYY